MIFFSCPPPAHSCGVSLGKGFPEDWLGLPSPRLRKGEGKNKKQPSQCLTKTIKREVWNYNKADWVRLKDCLKDHDWSELHGMNANDAKQNNNKHNQESSKGVHRQKNIDRVQEHTPVAHKGNSQIES